MEFIFSNHALEQMTRRGIARETVLMALNQPQQVVEDNVVITLYKTTKIWYYHFLCGTKSRLP